MIKINEKGSKAINTGENISNVLSTFIETGPKDDLNAVDGYQAPSPDALEKLKGTDCECDTPANELASGSGLFGSGGGGGSTGSGSGNSDSDNNDVPGTNGLWTALLCGGRSRGGGGSNTPTTRQMAAVSLWMRLLGCEASDILKLVNTRGDKPQLNVDVLKSRLSSAFGRDIGELSKEDKDALIADMRRDEESGNNNNDESEEEDSSLVIDGVKKAFSAVSLDDAKSFAKMLESSGGDDVSVEVEDKSSKSHIQLATFDKAIALNDPDSFGRVAANVERTPKTRRLFLSKTNKVARSGNISMMNHLIDIVGVDMLLSRYPDIIRDIIRWYVLPNDKSNSEALTELVGTLERIDSSWNQVMAYGALQSDIEPYTWCSPDAEDLFMSSSDHRTQVMMANDYRKSDKRTLINQYHDYYAMTA